MRGLPGQHQAVLAQAAGVKVVAVRQVGAQPVGAHAGFPLGVEAVHRGQITRRVAGATRGVLAQPGLAREFERQAQLPRAVVAIGRPFPHAIDHPQVLAGELRAVRMALVAVVVAGRHAVPVIVVMVRVGRAPVAQVRQAQLPAVLAPDVAADLGRQRPHAGSRLALDFARELLAAEDLDAGAPVEIGRRRPVQAQAVVEVVPAQKTAVQQRPRGEVVGVRVLLVQVAHLRHEAPAAQLQAGRQRGGADPDFLEVLLDLLVVAVRGGGDAAFEPRAERRGQRQLGATQVQALVAVAQGQFLAAVADVEHDAERRCEPTGGGCGRGYGRSVRGLRGRRRGRGLGGCLRRLGMDRQRAEGGQGRQRGGGAQGEAGSVVHGAAMPSQAWPLGLKSRPMLCVTAMFWLSITAICLAATSVTNSVSRARLLRSVGKGAAVGIWATPARSWQRATAPARRASG